jgi:hypothetical protein
MINSNLVIEGQEGHNQDITNYLDCELKIGQSKVAQQRTEVQKKNLWDFYVGCTCDREQIVLESDSSLIQTT